MSAVVVWGLGQLGGVFARGLLQTDRVVCPVTRRSDASRLAQQWPDPELVLVAVAEADLDLVLAQMPEAWRERVALLQNELVPSAWQHLAIDPSVCVVWFEKRATSEVRVVLPSVCWGPNAGLLIESLSALSIPARVVSDRNDLLFELALKNLYILTINCAGLAASGDVIALWQNERVTLDIAHEVVNLQSALMGQALDEAKLIERLEGAILADPHHTAKGRSAPERLRRSMAHADRLGLSLPTLQKLADRLN